MISKERLAIIFNEDKEYKMHNTGFKCKDLAALLKIYQLCPPTYETSLISSVHNGYAYINVDIDAL